LTKKKIRFFFVEKNFVKFGNFLNKKKLNKIFWEIFLDAGSSNGLKFRTLAD